MNISDVGINLLIGIASGIISSIIVTRAFMLIQDYIEQLGKIEVMVLKIYRIDIYLRVIISQAQKYISYEENSKLAVGEIADFQKEASFLNTLFEQLREESMFFVCDYTSLEQYRCAVKSTFQQPINDILTYNVDELLNYNQKVSELYTEYEEIKSNRKKEIMAIVIKDVTILVVAIGALLLSLILIA